MLEIRNVTKIYRSKTGESVKALDNVSISFPESGMVFILGKSGSGKSTLLNVIGGLDGYDGGEFVIMGKSSKDFGGSDFDAYRNTFIGFIFQEYNILDDFTVGANIGLALELQGKKATNEKINQILDQVDLTNYAKRKPNELSGGQKQRVAIARALVKEPQIIMADEPTGALDSGTGKQIFDTLKKLSEQKLVLIVSHDRDFAEKYADRIIELADGRVISDVTKHNVPSTRLSDGVHRVSNNIFRIEKGYRLTERDLELINEYIASNQSDVILSGDVRVNQELRSAAGITEDGGTSVFEHTDGERDYSLKQYDGKKTKFIKSRLPMKNAVRIGASGLKHKKFRLVLTILLSTVAFAMFGLADTMAVYQKITSATDSIIDSGITNASVRLGVRHDYYYDGELSGSYHEIGGLNDSDLDFLRQETGLNFIPVFTGSLDEWTSGFSIASNYATFEQNDVYTGKITGFIDVDNTKAEGLDLELMAGRLPEKTGEIVISELLLRSFNEYGFKNPTHKESVSAGQLSNAENILGKHLNISSSMGGIERTFVIVGVVDTHFDYTRYESFLPSDTPSLDGGIGNMVLALELMNEMSYGLHALAIAHEDDINSISQSISASAQQIGTYMSGWNDMTYIVLNLNGDGEDGEKDDGSYSPQFSTVATSDELSKLSIEWINGEKTELADNEVIISRDYLNYFLPESVELSIDTAKLAQKVNSIYGIGAWETVDPSAYYSSRVEMLSMQQGMKTYIKEMLTDVEIYAAVCRHAIARGTAVLTKAAAEQYWFDYWMANNYDAPLLDYSGNKTVKDPYQLQEEHRADLALALFPYLVESIYGIECDADVTSTPLGKQVTVQTVVSILDGITDENSSKSLTSYDIYSALEQIYDYCDYVDAELWLDDDFSALFVELNGWNESDWEALDYDSRQSMGFDFYRNIYKPQLTDTSIVTYTDSELNSMATDIYISMLDTDPSTLLSNVKFDRVVQSYELNTTTVIESYTVNIVGWIVNDTEGAVTRNDLIFSDVMHNDYVEWYAEEERKAMGDDNVFSEERAPHDDGIWAFAVAPMGSDRATVQKLVEMSYAEGVDIKFSLQNSVMYTLSSFNEFIEMGADIFLYVGIGFAVFSALLLMNFISISISYKKREIGILRAVGARSSDVFKIFFSEAFIIAIINFILSLTAVMVATSAINGWMRSEGINITLLHFGIRQVALMLLISAAVAAIASFFPVYRTARRKPIDAIKDK